MTLWIQWYQSVQALRPACSRTRTSAAMFFSLLVAFIITPYVTLRLLGGTKHEAKPASGPEAETPAESRIERLYAAIMRPLIQRGWLRAAVLGGVALILPASISLFYFRAVRVKMLPYDNKSEFQVIVDMPEGTTLE